MSSPLFENIFGTYLTDRQLLAEFTGAQVESLQLSRASRFMSATLVCDRFIEIEKIDAAEKALSAALSLLMKGGVCTICAYPGHAAGDEERAALMAYLSALRPQEYNVLHHRFLNAGAGAPECFVVQRQ